MELHSSCHYPLTSQACSLLINQFIFRYSSSPWYEIYINDTESPQSFEVVEALRHTIRKVYVSLGYTFIELPKIPVTERCHLMLEHG
jgi:predicted ATPase